MAGAPGPDGRHDDLDGDELEGLALLVPDDPRSLDADRVAYLRELRQRARPPLARRVLPSGGITGYGLAGPVLLVLLLVAGLVGSTLSVFGTQPGATQQLAPLATAPAAPVGSVGGLLPDVTVSVHGSAQRLRDARAAVIVLVPAGCHDCSPALRSLKAQAGEYGLLFVLLGPSSQATELRAVADFELGGATVAVDTADVVRSLYRPQGVTAVLVARDGVVGAVVRDVTGGTRLESALTQLARGTAAA
ncbi:MAG: hypothetical protein ACXV4A_15930 [Actinomycetes bacterium]